jgi:hypothetical protein
LAQVDDWIKKLAMARQLRIQYEGAIYHLMSRGDRREEIFRDDLDRKSFLHGKNSTWGRRMTKEARMLPPSLGFGVAGK